MVTIQIEKENIKLTNTKFATFSDFIEYKFGNIIKENNNSSYDINILEKKYLG